MTTSSSPASAVEGFGRLDEHSLRLFVESVSDYAIFMLDPRGYVVSWNVGAQRIKGYRVDEIVGQHFSRFYSDDDVANGKPARALEVASVAGRVEDEGWRVRKDGSRFWASVVITAVRDADGRLAGFGKVTRDMTDLHAQIEANERLTIQLREHAQSLEHQVERRTAELLRSNEDLRHSNVALETFAYSISHDLRGPLRTIKGFAEILLTDHAAAVAGEAGDFLARIAAAAGRLSDLVESLLTYSRLTRTRSGNQVQRVSLDRAVDAVLAEIPPAQRPAGTLQVARPLGEVLAEREAVGLIVRNLITNALKFVRPEVGARVRVWTERQQDALRLNVEDNGVGIDGRHRELIFRPFERLHASAVYPGVGLGLAIVSAAVTRLGARCGVTSDGATGSRFWVEFAADSAPVS
jgi:PAS domain S-box-containing protein